MYQALGDTEAFIQALGVTVKRVDDLDGKCAVYVPEDKLAVICTSLCPGRGHKAMIRLLERIA